MFGSLSLGPDRFTQAELRRDVSPSRRAIVAAAPALVPHSDGHRRSHGTFWVGAEQYAPKNSSAREWTTNELSRRPCFMRSLLSTDHARLTFQCAYSVRWLLAAVLQGSLSLPSLPARTTSTVSAYESPGFGGTTRRLNGRTSFEYRTAAMPALPPSPTRDGALDLALSSIKLPRIRSQQHRVSPSQGGALQRGADDVDAGSPGSPAEAEQHRLPTRERQWKERFDSWQEAAGHDPVLTHIMRKTRGKYKAAHAPHKLRHLPVPPNLSPPKRRRVDDDD